MNNCKLLRLSCRFKEENHLKEVKIKRVDVNSVFKSSITVFGGIGFIAGIIFGILGIILIPVKVTTAMNGVVTNTKAYPTSQIVGNSFTVFISSILYCTIFAILLSILITLIAFLFNLLCNAIGGIKIHIEE